MKFISSNNTTDNKVNAQGLFKTSSSEKNLYFEFFKLVLSRRIPAFIMNRVVWVLSCHSVGQSASTLTVTFRIL